MPAVIAIKVAARIDVRIDVGASSENENGAFEFGMIASVFWVLARCMPGTHHDIGWITYSKRRNHLTENARTPRLWIE